MNVTPRTIPTAILAALFVFGCAPKEPVANSTEPVNTPPKEAPGTPPSQEAVTTNAALDSIPSELKSDAFYYYGLSATAPIKMAINAPNAAAPVTGSQTVKFTGMDGGKAKFTISRDGGLAALGSEDVVLDKSGVNAVSSSLGKLKGTSLEMPADLKPGVTWKSDVTLDMGSNGMAEDHSLFKVVGTQKVTTKVGTYDALLVESHGNQSAAGQKSIADIKFWFVKDRGAVKMEIKNTPAAGGSPTVTTIEEVP